VRPRRFPAPPLPPPPLPFPDPPLTPLPAILVTVLGAHTLVPLQDFAPYTCIHNISQPTCMPTLCRTSCGDRVCFADADKVYESAVAGRFGFTNEYGQPKIELFSPTGGGTDSAATLAHVSAPP